MQALTGKPELMKQMNMTLIYKALIELKSATRAEIAENTQVSTTTVRTLLEELLQNGEIIALQLDESSGGRRAQRYTLNPERNLILSLYFQENLVVYQVCDLAGNIIKSDSETISEDNLSLSVNRMITECMKTWKFCAIGLGVPGIIQNEAYYISSGFNLWYINNLGEQIRSTYHLPVILENDLNSIALGFAMHYAKEHQLCDISGINMVYIHFNYGCTGAGIIADGKIVRGAKQFGGELGFLPILPDQILDNVLQESKSPEESADVVARLIAIVNCVTNPSLFVIGGKRFETDWIQLETVQKYVQKYISSIMQPEILFSNQFQDDYLAGLQYAVIQNMIPKLPIVNET